MNSVGRDRPALRVVPAQQRLEGADPPVAHRDQRLVEQLELAPLQRQAQIALQQAPFLRVQVHFGREEPHGAAAVLAGSPLGQFGVAQHRVGVGIAGRAERDAGGGAECRQPVGDRIGLAQHLQQAAGECRGAGRLADPGLHHHEDIGTHAADRVGGAHMVAQALCGLAQHLVAGLVPQRSRSPT